jgi:hypothetical protein
MQNPRINLIGKRFGSLVVISRTHHDKKNKAQWSCQCDCGNMTIATGHDLRRGHRKSCGCKFFLRKDDTTCRSLWSTYKSLATKRGYSFELPYELFKETTQKDCYYCGKNPEQVLKGKKEWYSDFVYNGIDRFDNSKGYTPTNIVPCCVLCNRFKSSLNIDVFLGHCEKIMQYQNSKKSAEMSDSITEVMSNNKDLDVTVSLASS